MKQKLFSAIMILLTACEYDDTGIKTNPIDSNIIIETREVLGEESRRLTFHCKTAKSYECSNYPIATKKTINENSFNITFTGIGEIRVCLTALGPATTVVDLNTLENGVYLIEFNNTNLQNKGALTITDSEIELIFPDQHGIEILRPVTKRVPPKTYWGIIKYRNVETVNRVNEFLQKLEDRGAVFNKQEPGHYFYYEIDESGDMVMDAARYGSRFVKGFVFQYYGEEDEFSQDIKALALPYYDAMSVDIETYKGETINNRTN